MCMMIMRELCCCNMHMSVKLDSFMQITFCNVFLSDPPSKMHSIKSFLANPVSSLTFFPPQSSHLPVTPALPTSEAAPQSSGVCLLVAL